MSEKGESSSSPEGGTEEATPVRKGYYRKSSCSFCSSSVFLRGEDTPQDNEMRSLLLKTLCLQLPLTNHKIPNPKRVDILFKERDKVLEQIWVKTEEGRSADDLTRANGEWPLTMPMGYQIRKMILAATRYRTVSVQVVFENGSEAEGQPFTFQKEEETVLGESWEDDSAVDSTSPEVPQVSSTLSEGTTNLEPPESVSDENEETTHDENSVESLSVECASTAPNNVPETDESVNLEASCSASCGGENETIVETERDEDNPGLGSIVSRLKANGVQILENGGSSVPPNSTSSARTKMPPTVTPSATDTENAQEKSQPRSSEEETDDDDLFEIQLKKRKVVVDGLRMFLCTGFQEGGKTTKYYECRDCPFSTSLEDGVGSSALEKTKAHVQEQHKKRPKRKKSPPTCNFTGSTGNLPTIDPNHPIYKPVIRIRRFDAAFPKKEEPKMPSLVTASHFVQRYQHKTEKELEEARLMPPPPPKLQGPMPIRRGLPRTRGRSME